MMRLLLGAMLWIAVSGVADASVLSDILSRKVLHIGATGDYPPFAERNPATGEMTGFDVDLARSLGDALGVRIEFVATTWTSLAKDFEARKFDIGMGGISVTLERAKIGFFTTPVLSDGKTPIVRCSDKQKFQTLADIDRPGTTVLVNPGGGNEKFDRTHLHAARILVRPDNLKIFEALATGEGDLMITDASETRYQQRRHSGVLCAIHPDAPFDFAEKAYWAPYDPAFDGFLDQWLHTIRLNGTFAAIYAKWF